MNKDNLVKILIPIIALVVIIESVVLVSGLNKTGNNQTVEEVTIIPTQKEEEASQVADFVFATDTKEMEVGKAYEVVLNLLGKEDFAVDAVEAYVKYDPSKVVISKLAGGSDLPEATILKNDQKSGVISAAFLVPVEEKSGYEVGLDETKEIISFVVTPKTEGLFDLSLVTSGDEGGLVTVLPETGTSNELSFASNKLEINVTK